MITEKTTISLGFKAWWALLTLCFLLGVGVTTYQLQTNRRIEQLYHQVNLQHEQVMAELKKIDEHQLLYALKAQVEDTLVFVARRTDILTGKVELDAKTELELRKQIREFLK